MLSRYPSGAHTIIYTILIRMDIHIIQSDNDITVLTFNLTWACPTRCSYCYRALSHDQAYSETLSREDVIKHATIAKKNGIKEYRISGGEPLSIGEELFEYAEIIFEITGLKPILMTSGYLIDDAWMKKAENKFSAVAISIDNPLESKKSLRVLDLIKHNTSNGVPLTYGLTLIKRHFFKDLKRIFSYLYQYVDYKFMPQLDYPCLGNTFEEPTYEQLQDLENNTAQLFRHYGLIPYYFVYLVGSLLWLKENQQRIVLNLHPEGNYQIYDSLEERLSIEYRWRYYLLDQQRKSKICQECDWLDSCKHHPLWDLRYDWCSIRKAIFQGMYKALIDE